MITPLSRSAWRLAGPIVVAVAVAVIAPAMASASTPFTDIHSAGPLSDIYIGNDLGCQVQSGGFSSTEFFPNAAGPGDCGTFLFLTGDNVSGGLFGPDFANHANGTHTSFAQGESPFTPASQSLTGSGTAASPYQLTTVVTFTSPTGNTPVELELTEVDSYVVGNDFYQTDLTVTNIGTVPDDNGGFLYHAADCLLRGSNTGFGAPEPSQAAQDTAACTVNLFNNPPSALEQFVPITPGDSWTEASATASPTVWSELSDAALPDGCGSCRVGTTDNAQGIAWSFPGLAAGVSSQTFSFKTEIVDTVPAGGFSFNGSPGTSVGGTVATITDPNTSATASAYSATINWGDNSSSTGTITGGNGTFNVAGNHTYSAAGTYPVSVTITAVGTNQGSSTVTDSAVITSPPPPTTAPSQVITGAPTVSATGAAFTGSVDPGGLPTTAFFQYGLDPKYAGASGIAYTQSTPAQPVGSDFTSHSLSASVSGLVPNAVYHVRLVATNSAGTTVGPDVTFTTLRTPLPGPPALGKTFNISLVSGLVLVKIHGVFVPLTELTQIPTNTVIDALRGTISLTTAINGGGARDAAAKGKKHKTKTQTGTFGGAIFKITQAHSGLATLALVGGAFAGAPTYATCTAHRSADASAAALSSKTLQLLHASGHGKFRTTGRYSAATVRGTKWTIADRCDGTLTHDITDSVEVTDFVRHKTIVLHAGQSYLARAPKHR
jgi:hypothetical protein